MGSKLSILVAKKPVLPDGSENLQANLLGEAIMQEKQKGKQLKKGKAWKCEEPRLYGSEDEGLLEFVSQKGRMGGMSAQDLGYGNKSTALEPLNLMIWLCAKTRSPY